MTATIRTLNAEAPCNAEVPAEPHRDANDALMLIITAFGIAVAVAVFLCFALLIWLASMMLAWPRVLIEA